eukprot:SAG11_NODE_6297_length_1342_cov_2.492357_1_plen_208_part_00
MLDRLFGVNNRHNMPKKNKMKKKKNPTPVLKRTIGKKEGARKKIDGLAVHLIKDNDGAGGDRDAQGIRMCQIADSEYAQLISGVMALPPKKRRNWKHGNIRDKKGVKSTTIFREGKLLNKCLNDNGIHYWTEVQSTGMVIKMMEDAEVGDWQVNTPTGAMAVAAGLGIIPQETFQSFLAEVVKDNQTGNHYRNHTVKVPARAYGRDI